jgi:hypothetical protein
VVGDLAAPLREKHDPDFHIAKSTDITSLLSSKPVDVVVSFNQVPSSSHPVWSNLEVEEIIWISSKQVRQGSRFPKGWKVSRQSLTHNSVGGMTDGRFWVGIGLREEPGTIGW